jgi:bifunctional non-homologous end joining protein LigD
VDVVKESRMPRIEVEITHPDRVLFPDDGITKGDLVDYYTKIAPSMLRHLKGRPLMVQRSPRGIGEPGFVQKDFEGALPEWMSWIEVEKQDGTVVHAVADRPEAVVWLANQDCITPHMWLSQRGRLDQPDRMIFDLDPSGSADFAAVRESAHTLAEVLDGLGLVAYLQVTGSRGVHVVVPLDSDADFDTVRQFARDVADLVIADDPGQRTLELRKDRRGDRVYFDVMRNAYAQTAVAPYAVRTRPGAPVATPIEWSELDDASMRPDRFTIREVAKRVAEHGDPWAGLGRHARSLSGPVDKLRRMSNTRTR